MKPSLSTLLIGFILSISFLGATVPPAFAQTQNPYQKFETSPDVPLNQRTAIEATLMNVLASAICHLSGIDPMQYTPGDPQAMSKSQCLGFDPTTKKIAFVENSGGVLGMSTTLIAMIYEAPQANSFDYTRYLAGNFGVVEKAHAQATGFESLNPLLRVWAVFRNITYLLFVIAFVVIGFLIMIRVKIDPRTVMSIQNSIPKLIIGLILITFSYAISGFLIDLMWVSTYTSVGVLSTAVEATDASETFEENDATSHLLDYPFRFFNTVFAGEWAGLVGVLGIIEFSRNAADGVGIFFRSATGSGSFTDIFFQDIESFDTTPAGNEDCQWRDGCRIVRGLIGSVTGAVATVIEVLFGIIFAILSWLIAGLAFFVVLVALIVTLFRIWFVLIRAYINILLATVWAPFWIIMGMVPGSSINFVQWLRYMIAHLALFPATVIMFLMARIFIQVFEPANSLNIGNLAGENDNTLFLPPLVGNLSVPEAIGPIIAFGVIMSIPSMLNLLRDALKTPAGKYGGGFGQGVGAGVAPIRGAVGAGVAAATSIPEPGKPGGWKAALSKSGIL